MFHQFCLFQYGQGTGCEKLLFVPRAKKPVVTRLTTLNNIVLEIIEKSSMLPTGLSQVYFICDIYNLNNFLLLLRKYGNIIQQ